MGQEPPKTSLIVLQLGCSYRLLHHFPALALLGWAFAPRPPPTVVPAFAAMASGPFAQTLPEHVQLGQRCIDGRSVL